MAERIQLKDPGSELVMKVGSVKPETVEKNDYWLFSNGSKELLVPQSSITAQLSRLEIHGATDLIGQTVRFGRSMKMSRANKPYWDIDIVSGAEAPSQSVQRGEGGNASNPAGASPAESSPKPKMRDAYKSLTEWVLKEIVPLYDAEYGEGACGPDVAAACVQTLYIQACYSGKVE